MQRFLIFLLLALKLLTIDKLFVVAALSKDTNDNREIEERDSTSNRKSDETPPNLIYILVDDWGYNNVGYHFNRGIVPEINDLNRRFSTSTDSLKDKQNEIQTPNIDQLASEGIILERHYAFHYCSPSRAAIQSGRNPIHVDLLPPAPIGLYNPNNIVSGASGIPRNMTTLATRLRDEGNYETIFAGKWNAGVATRDHIPMGRGYDHSLCYLAPVNSYWRNNYDPASMGHIGYCSEDLEMTYNFTDLWMNDAPAWQYNNSLNCKQNNPDDIEQTYQNQDTKSDCVYEEDLFVDFIMETIDSLYPSENKTNSKPLFLFYAPHLVHTPLQVPEKYLRKFSFIDNIYRRYYAAMVNYLDYLVGKLKTKLIEKNMWHNTLLVLTSDNGGPSHYAKLTPFASVDNITNIPSNYQYAFGGGNNYPLRGGKGTPLEGGIRTNAFVSGGYIPSSRRGITLNKSLFAIEDWYATFLGRAGIKDPSDKKATDAGLPDIDSIDQWDVLNGTVLENLQESKRKEVVIGSFQGPNIVRYEDENNKYSIEHEKQNKSNFLRQNRDILRETNSHFSAKSRSILEFGTSPSVDPDPPSVDPIIVQGLINEQGYKILVGNITQTEWQGQLYPNESSCIFGIESNVLNCGETTYPYDGACFFNIFDDESEYYNLAPNIKKMSLKATGNSENNLYDIFNKMKERLRDLQVTVFNPDRGVLWDFPFSIAMNQYKGFVGPFAP